MPWFLRALSTMRASIYTRDTSVNLRACISAVPTKGYLPNLRVSASLTPNFLALGCTCFVRTSISEEKRNAVTTTYSALNSTKPPFNEDYQMKKRKSDEPARMLFDGSYPFQFRNDVAFDIETAPLDADHEDGALLNPETARVAAIGYFDPDMNRCLITLDQDEAAMLQQFWDAFKCIHAAGYKLHGFNSCNFDLPFLVRRSWSLGVPVPRNIMTGGGRYWCDTFVDLMVHWRCGQYKEFISLDTLARFLHVGQKNGRGVMFYKLIVEDRVAALDYLQNDVWLTYRCAKHMGVVSPIIRS